MQSNIQVSAESLFQRTEVGIYKRKQESKKKEKKIDQEKKKSRRKTRTRPRK